MSNQSAGLPDVAITRESLLRRRHRLQNMMLTATILCVAASCSNQPEPAPKTPAPATAPHVVLYAEGEGTKAAAATMRTESGGMIQKDVALPLTDTSTNTAGLASDQFKHGDTLYLSLQNKEATGSVTCRIEVDGKVIDKATSSGPYKIVTCVGKVP